MEKLRADWQENMLYVARCYKAKNDKANTKKYLDAILALSPADDSDREAQEEAKRMLKTL